MRKINMRRKNRKEKSEQRKAEDENGVDAKEASDDETAKSSDSEHSERKRNGDKRKSGTPKKAKKGAKSAKNGKKESEPEANEEEEKEEGEAEYEVEEVLDEKMIRNVQHFLIRWKGYGPESDTWEPESTLQCADLIKKFKAARSEDTENESGQENKKGKKRIKKGPKINHKKPKKDALEVNWESDEEFEVERINDVYFKRNGKREFLIIWKGYPTSQASWEPEENLDCADLIAKFMSKVEAARNVDQRELRMNRTPTERFTPSMRDKARRWSRRLDGRRRIQYHDTE